ncbi:isoamyl acetate-hydrolyzing esterase [Coemansia spiralis]|nr:isoamyl acetate-hydrolyzing esterase [Coemansia spiralis]
MTKFLHLVIAGVVGCGLGWTVSNLYGALLAAPAVTAVVEEPSPAVYPAYDVLLAFGDSITQLGGDPELGGYVARLADLYQRQMDVVNRGFAGFNSNAARGVVDRVFPVTQPAAAPGALEKRGRSTIWPSRDRNRPGPAAAMQLCILFFGANDAVEAPSKTHVPIDQYADNLRHFIALLRDPASRHYSPKTRILIVTPPAVSDRMARDTAKKLDIFHHVSSASTKLYAERAIAVAREASLPFVDLNSAIETKVKENVAEGRETGAYGGYERFLADGLHLTAGGYELLYKLIIDQIKANWPEILPGPPTRATVLKPPTK